MGCQDDPTEPPRIDRRELIRMQEHYGELIRDLLTGDPERPILKLLDEANGYLRELAALRAHYPSVRLRAIGLLEKSNAAVLKQIIEKEPETEFARAAGARLGEIDGTAAWLLQNWIKP